MSNSRTKLGDTALRVANRGTCNCLGDRSNIRHLIEISPFSTSNEQRASFTSLRMVPRVSSSGSVRVERRSVGVSIFHSSNTNNRRVGGASSTIHLARVPANVIITYRGRHDRFRGERRTVGLLGSGLLRVGRHRRLRGVSSVGNIRGRVT